LKRLLFILVSICLLTGTTDAMALAGAGATLLTFNSSVRSEGMGGAGVAQHWGGDPDMWANSANIAFQGGLRYYNMESQLAVGLAPDIVLTDKWLAYGRNGLGLFFARGPIDGAFIDMGEQINIDEDNNVTGTASSWMKAERMGAGLSLIRLIESFRGNEDHRISRLFEVSAGYVSIDYEDKVSADQTIQDGYYPAGSAGGTAASYGVLARLSPINTLHNTQDVLGGVRLSCAYGMSVLNKSDEMLSHDGSTQNDPFPTMHLRGWSVHVETGFPGAVRHSLAIADREWIADSLTPLISVGYAEQLIEPGILWNGEDYEYKHDTRGEFDQESWGWEISIANIWHVRSGHTKVDYGDVDGDTSGYGFGFQIGSKGGIRWDKATVPQAQGLPTVERESWTVWARFSSW
jgi:hypothetical protein